MERCGPQKLSGMSYICSILFSFVFSSSHFLHRRRKSLIILFQGSLNDNWAIASSLAAEISSNPQLHILRFEQIYPQIGNKSSSEKNSTIVFPVPMDMMSVFGGKEKDAWEVFWAFLLHPHCHLLSQWNHFTATFWKPLTDFFSEPERYSGSVGK